MHEKTKTSRQLCEKCHKENKIAEEKEIVKDEVDVESLHFSLFIFILD